MSSCCVKWCGKNSKTSGSKIDGITFYKFPRDPELKQKWIEVTRRENWFPTTYSKICSRHFTEDCFLIMKSGRKRLFDTAIPTEHLPLLPQEIKSSKMECTQLKIHTPIDLTNIPSNFNSSSETKSQSEDKKPLIIEKLHETIDELAHTNQESPIKSTNSTIEKKLCRKVTELSMRLKNKTLHIKRLSDANVYLKKKVKLLTKLLEKLKNKELLTQESIDIDRLQNSNRQLRKKVNWLKQMLKEQKNKNWIAGQHVVWCPTVEEIKVQQT